ncbi:hypothetical protein D3C79_809050 [compost metagenome]
MVAVVRALAGVAVQAGNESALSGVTARTDQRALLPQTWCSPVSRLAGSQRVPTHPGTAPAGTVRHAQLASIQVDRYHIALDHDAGQHPVVLGARVTHFKASGDW